MWAIVPVKDLGAAKQRLAAILSLAERQALFRAMVEDVIVALTAVSTLDGVALVTRDAWAADLARRLGVRVIPEEANRGHTAAVGTAIATLMREGVDTMLTVPGDVPLVRPEEVAAVVAAHRSAPAMTIAPAADKQGSNAVALSPPDAVPLRFGPDSFYPHLTAARSRGIEPTIVERPGLARDVDTPEDLAAFLASPSETRAYAYAQANGLGDRLACGRVLASAVSG